MGEEGEAIVDEFLFGLRGVRQVDVCAKSLVDLFSNRSPLT